MEGLLDYRLGPNVWKRGTARRTVGACGVGGAGGDIAGIADRRGDGSDDVGLGRAPGRRQRSP